MPEGFGFKLTPEREITMWVDDAESEPLNDAQLDEVINTVKEFMILRHCYGE